MKKLIEKTKDDESIGVEKNYIFEEVHAASTGIDAFNSDNQLSKSLLFKHLLPENILHMIISLGNKITSIGKENPEYTNI